MGKLGGGGSAVLSNIFDLLYFCCICFTPFFCREMIDCFNIYIYIYTYIYISFSVCLKQHFPSQWIFQLRKPPLPKAGNMKVGLWGSDTFGRGHIPPGSNVMRVSVMREGVAHER